MNLEGQCQMGKLQNDFKNTLKIIIFMLCKTIGGRE